MSLAVARQVAFSGALILVGALVEGLVEGADGARVQDDSRTDADSRPRSAAPTPETAAK